MQYQFFKTMQQKQIVSRSQPNWEPGQTDRKNISGSLHRYIDYQLSDQQAQSIQSKLPKGFFLVNLNNGDLEKLRQQVRISSVKIEPSRNQTSQMEDKKSQKKIQVKQKQKSNNLSKKSKISQLPKIVEVQISQKIRKQIGMKKKASTKNYDIKQSQSDKYDDDSMQQQFLVEQNKQTKKGQNSGVQKTKKKQQQPKQKQKKVKEAPKQVPMKQKQHNRQVEQQIKHNTNVALNQPLPNFDEQFCSYIAQLPSGIPRFNPQASQMPPQGSIQTNTLRFLFGLHHSYPIQASVPKLSQKQKHFCMNIIQRLAKHKSSQGFKVPVDPVGQGVPDYHHIIYNPMDLQTIQRKLKKDKYKQISEFHMDVNLIFLNSYKYNRRETFYFNAAVQFQDYYNQLLKEAERNPQQFAKQYVAKIKGKPQNAGELDYTQMTPLKKKKKNQLRSSVILAKSQIIQKQVKFKQVKGKNVYDDMSGIYSQSMIAEAGGHDFNIDVQHPISNQVKQTKKSIIEQKKQLKLKKIKSMNIDKLEIQNISHSGQVQNISQTNSVNPIPMLDNINNNINMNTNSGDDEDYEQFSIKQNQRNNKNKKKAKPKPKDKQKQKDKQFTKTLANQIKEMEQMQQYNETQKNNKPINPITNDQSYPQNIPNLPSNQQQPQNQPVQIAKKAQQQKKTQDTKKKTSTKQVKFENKSKFIHKHKYNSNRRKDDYNDDDDDQIIEQNQQMQNEEQYNQQMNISEMSVNDMMSFQKGFESGKSIHMNQNEMEDDLSLLFPTYNDNIKPKEQVRKQQSKQKGMQPQKVIIQQKKQQLKPIHQIQQQKRKQQPKSTAMQAQKPVIAQQQRHVKNDIIINNLVQGEKHKYNPSHRKSTTHHHHYHSNQQSITVNNINQHPPIPNTTSFEVVIENMEHLSSTAHPTTASTGSSHQKSKNINKGSAKPKKPKTRDQQYRQQSDDEQYVTNQNKARKNKEKAQKPRTKKKDQDVSYSQEGRNGNTKKRGRHAKKTISKNSQNSARTPMGNQSINFDNNQTAFIQSNPSQPQPQTIPQQRLPINPSTNLPAQTPNFGSNPSHPSNPSPYQSANIQQSPIAIYPQQNKKQITHNNIFLQNGDSQMNDEGGLNFEQLINP